MKTTLKHTAPDGKTYTRTTARPYTHVLVADYVDGTQSGFVLSWTANPATAAKPYSTARWQRTFKNLRVEQINNGEAA